MKVVARAGKTPEPHAYEAMVNLQMSKAHLDALLFIARFEEGPSLVSMREWANASREAKLLTDPNYQDVLRRWIWHGWRIRLSKEVESDSPRKAGFGK